MAIDNRESIVKDYLATVSEIIAQLPAGQITDLVATLRNAYDEGRQVLICGNGGSAATASHLACDLQKGIGALSDRKFRALAMTDAMPILTAWANDTDYSNVFAEQVQTWGAPGDVLIAISGSGNSPNVLRAVEAAKSKDMITVGLSGIGGGKLAKMVEQSIVVPSDNMQQVEDVHVVLAHLVFTCLCREIGSASSLR